MPGCYTTVLCQHLLRGTGESWVTSVRNCSFLAKNLTQDLPHMMQECYPLSYFICLLISAETHCVCTHEGRNQCLQCIIFFSSSVLLLVIVDLFVFQAQINVMANRQNASNSSQPTTHAENDNSSSVPPTTSAPPSTGTAAAQTETATTNTNQTQDAPQTQSARPHVTTQG
jgi:hypothetical protein